MLDMLLNLGGSFMGFLRQPLTSDFIQFIIVVGGAWLAGLLLSIGRLTKYRHEDTRDF